jgi:hypothetical protein
MPVQYAHLVPRPQQKAIKSRDSGLVSPSLIDNLWTPEEDVGKRQVEES